MANEDLKGSIFVDGVLQDLCGKRPSLQKAQWVPGIISIPVYSMLIDTTFEDAYDSECRECCIVHTAYSLPVKNNFLEILMFTQVKVPMKTAVT